MSEIMNLAGNVDGPKDPNDALTILKRYGENMLAVKVVKWRKGQLKLSDFWDELVEFCDKIGVIPENY